MLDSFFRQACSDCGGSVAWLDLDAVAKHPELAALMREAVDAVGFPVTSVWRCTRPACGSVGFCGTALAG